MDELFWMRLGHNIQQNSTKYYTISTKGIDKKTIWTYEFFRLGKACCQKSFYTVDQNAPK